MLKQRVVTAVLVVAALYLTTVFLSPLLFAGFISLVMVLALLEWSNLAGWHKPVQRLAFVLAFTAVLVLSMLLIGSPVDPGLDIRWLVSLNLLAIVYWVLCYLLILHFPATAHRWDRPLQLTVMGVCSLLPVWWALVWLKTADEPGLLVFTLIALVSIADIGAYFSGRAWGKGRARLAPSLSPNKTWVGFWGGMASCVFLAAGVLLFIHLTVQPLVWWLWPLLLMAAALLAAFSVLGDLYVSMLKRQRGIKDCGRILPGHGGVLDRVDSLLPAAPVFVLGAIVLSTGTGLLS